jgi:hypothetical protein
MLRRTDISATVTIVGLLRKLTPLKVSNCFAILIMRDIGLGDLKPIRVNVETDGHLGYNDNRRVAEDTHLLKDFKLFRRRKTA